MSGREASDATIVVDRAGVIVRASRAAEDLVGVGPLAGRAARELVFELLAVGERLRVLPVELAIQPLEGEPEPLMHITLRDASRREEAIADLAAAEALFRSAFDSSPIGKALTDVEGCFERVNPAFADLVGMKPDELVGQPYTSVLHPDHVLADESALRALVDRERPQHRGETRYVHVQGHSLWVAVQSNAIEGPGHVRVFWQVQDITYRKRYEDNLRYLATHDPLTGLRNRASFARRLEDHAHLVQRYGADGAVLLLDLDHFKYVNDTLGHAAGDVLIARVAHVLQDRLRDSDVLARIGGDEFAALLPRATGDAAVAVANDLLDALREEDITVPATRDRTITASVGVATFAGEDEVSGEETLVSADLAMYDAKEAGRNQVVLFRTGPGHARMQSRVTWAERIALAIQEDRFTLVAQPIVDFHSGRTTQFEVLLRMRDENGELIPPGAFLYIAERLGMIDQIDALTVRKALRTVAAHEHGRESWVELNLSGASIGRPEVMEVIETELRETGLDPGHVIFEVTETAAISNLQRAREFSERLGTLGCRFALDDFGAGFGSFYYLKHIAFDYLKIDGEFVRDCVASATDQLVIQSVVGIAQGLGRRTVAEHVGDTETVSLLRDLGVDYGQGYHLGHPVPLETLLDSLPAAAGN